jgi:hypothetical protein
MPLQRARYWRAKFGQCLEIGRDCRMLEQRRFASRYAAGTGPKAGGPDYLRRFALEQVVTVNTAASGGNATLLSEDE